MGAIARWYRTGAARPILEPQWSGTSPSVTGLRSGHPTDLPLNCTTLNIPVKSFDPSFYSTDADVKAFMGAHVFLGATDAQVDSVANEYSHWDPAAVSSPARSLRLSG